MKTLLEIQDELTRNNYQFQSFYDMVIHAGTRAEIVDVSKEAAEIYAEQFKPKWISVDERLPELILHKANTSERVYIFVDGFVTIASLCKSEKYQEYYWSVHDNTLDYDYEKCNPTHWMPLPEKP